MTTGELGAIIGLVAIFIIVLLIVTGAVCLYFLPYEISRWRKTCSRWPIFALNLLLGWSCIGWVAALVWACVDEKKDVRRIRLEREKQELQNLQLQNQRLKKAMQTPQNQQQEAGISTENSN